MPAEPPVRRHRALQIDRVALPQCTKAAAVKGFRHHVSGKTVFFQICNRQANAVDGNAVPDFCAGQHIPAANGDAPPFCTGNHMPDAADFFNQSCEHG